MTYVGDERRKEHVCLNHEVIHGNGKPGLVQDMADVKRGLWGDKTNNFPGVIVRQKIIERMQIATLILVVGMSVKLYGADFAINLVKMLFGVKP